MKKVLVILMSMFVSLSTFALGGIDEFLYIGANWGVATEIAKDETLGTLETQMNSFNFNFGCDSYLNENVGIAIDTVFGSINKITMSNEKGSIIGIDKNNIDTGLFLSSLLGVALKYDVSPKFQIFTNIGAHYGFYGVNLKITSVLAHSLGIGASLGGRFVFNRFFIQGGLSLSHDFWGYAETLTVYETTTESGYYNYTIFNPSIDIGIRI